MAKELRLSPNEVLDWKESDFYLWLSVSRDVGQNELLQQSVATSFSVWKPGELPKLLQDKQPMSEDEAVAALEKAEDIRNNVEFRETT